MALFNENVDNHVCSSEADRQEWSWLILVRKGISVTLIESQSDFDREFRGDTLHASSMEILDQLNMANPVLEFCHSKIGKAEFRTGRS